MANIVPNSDEKVYQLHKFLGLNQSPDGDTQLKMGEAAVQMNWMTTREGHLKVRNGYKTVKRYSRPVRGLWSGYVAGVRKTVCCADGGVWELRKGESPRRLGDIEDRPTTMFGFANKVYFLNGIEYLVWDGSGYIETVAGYIPLVVSASKPEGGGTTIENVNRLTGSRRVKFSADGKATEYHLPEKPIRSVDKVEVDGKEPATEWTVDRVSGTVKFTTPPETGTNNVQIWYTVINNRRPEVESMRFAEQFNGASDTRIFLYGDGTATAIYSGVTEQGEGSAEYFPDLYEIRIGSGNAPLTGMIKNYSRLMSYKADGGAYSTEYGVKSLDDKSIIPVFKTTSVHKEIGNSAPGQVRLVKNVPRTMYGGNLYDWVYANPFSRDERNVKLSSEKVQATMHEADPEKVFAFDDDRNQEYYLFLNDEKGTCIVQNYQADCWYLYDNLPVTCACRVDDYLLFGFSDGRLVRFSRESYNDDGEPINAIFATGNMSFDRDYKRKHSSLIWLSMQPTAFANLKMTAQTDRRNDYLDKEAQNSVFSFASADFSNWSFSLNDAPQMERLKLKVKKFAYYKLILKSNYAASDATVLGVDFRVRYTGYVK